MIFKRFVIKYKSSFSSSTSTVFILLDIIYPSFKLITTMVTKHYFLPENPTFQDKGLRMIMAIKKTIAIIKMSMV